MRYIIDRIEDKTAYLEAENGKITEIERISLPENAKEGNVLIYQDASYRIDSSQTSNRKKAAIDLLNSFKNGK